MTTKKKTEITFDKDYLNDFGIDEKVEKAAVDFVRKQIVSHLKAILTIDTSVGCSLASKARPYIVVDFADGGILVRANVYELLKEDIACYAERPAIEIEALTNIQEQLQSLLTMANTAIRKAQKCVAPIKG